MIPFLDLRAQYDELKTEIDAAIARVLSNSSFILGPEVAAFEEEFAAECGTAFAVGVNSGTSALHLALLAAGIGPGDEVITTPFTFYATTAAIEYCGAKPVYVDIERDSFNIDASQIEAAITPHTRAILPVHLYGQMADMQAINDLAHRHDLAVIEDAAQAHGATDAGRRAGSCSDAGCFSFYPTKNLGAAGEGGMITTNNPDLARKLRMLRDWGQQQKYRPVMKGFNYRLEGMQAAILRVKLRRLGVWNNLRRALAAEYDRLLQNAPLTTPRALPGKQHVYHLYTVRTPERDALQAALQAAGIATAVHYPVPTHLLPAYQDARYSAGSFPLSEEFSRMVLSLPLHPYLSTADIATICTSILRADVLSPHATLP